MRNASAPASMRWARPSSKPTVTATCCGYCAASGAHALPRCAGSPEPRTTSCTPSGASDAKGIGDQRQALLHVEAADGAEQHRVDASTGRPHARLQRALARGLAAQRRRPRRAPAGAGRWRDSSAATSMPLRMPVSLPRCGAQDAVEPVAEGRRLDLLGVARRDGGDRVGEDEAPLQQVEPAVELQRAGMEHAPVEARRCRTSAAG